MKCKNLTLYVSAIMLTISTPTLGAFEMTKAPIDTIFAQGEKNPYGKFFMKKIPMENFSPDKPI